FFRNRIGLPDLFPRGGIERYDRSTEGAAYVMDTAGFVFFERSQGNVQPSLVKPWIARDSRQRLRVCLNLPQQFAVGSVECVSVAVDIAEKRCDSRFSRFHRAQGNAAAHDRRRMERPVDAACLGVERILIPGIAADE